MTQMMQALVNTGPGEMTLQAWPRPEPGVGQVRVRVAACGICATDLAMIAGWERTGFPTIPGHEWAGVVDAVGEGVDHTLLGRSCVAENVLSDGGEVGFEHPGGYAEYLLTEASLVRTLPEAFPLHFAPLIEPLAVAIRGLRRLRLCPERETLVFGDGPIGLLMVILLRRAGVRQITLMGGRAGRLAIGGALGAHTTLNYHSLGTDLAAGVRAALGQDGLSQILEASGSDVALRAALSLAAPQARVLVLGDYGQARAGFLWNDLLHQELELIGSNASAGAWDEAVQVAAEEIAALSQLISRRLPAAQYAQAIRIASGHGDEVKIVLEW